MPHAARGPLVSSAEAQAMAGACPAHGTGGPPPIGPIMGDMALVFSIGLPLPPDRGGTIHPRSPSKLMVWSATRGRDTRAGGRVARIDSRRGRAPGRGCAGAGQSTERRQIIHMASSPEDARIWACTRCDTPHAARMAGGSITARRPRPRDKASAGPSAGSSCQEASGNKRNKGANDANKPHRAPHRCH